MARPGDRAPETVTLYLHDDRGAAIAVTQTGGVGVNWCWLPKSQISFTYLDKATDLRPRIEVTLPYWLARDKGLV